MTGWRFVWQSLWFHRRINVAVALGVAAATAVLTGALLVGDSVRGSLRRLTLDRLGRIDEVLVTDRFFRAALVDELASQAEFQRHFAAAVPAILFPHGTVEHVSQGGRESVSASRVAFGPSRGPKKTPGPLGRTSRASQVTIVACPPAFWDAGESALRPRTLPGEGQIVLNAPLAEELGVQRGAEVVLRLPKSQQLPADSPLGRKADRIRSVSGLRVVDIVPAEGLGRFRLQANQATPRNAYVAIETVQSALNQPAKANAIFVLGRATTAAPHPAAHAALTAAFQPTLADYGWSLDSVRRTYRPPDANTDEVIFDYLQLTTGRMLFEPAAQQAVERALAGQPTQAVFTYVATSIEKVPATTTPAPIIPYSLISAIDPLPLPAPRGGPGPALLDDEIALNSWAAADVDARVGERIRVTFFGPETTHGELRERSAEFTLAAVVPLTEPAVPYRRNRPAQYKDRPTWANDPDFTPVVEGLTDQDSISKWEAPFPVDYSRVRPQDDVYWKNHRTTPKAFVTLAAGRRLWGSRFGQTTSWRLPGIGSLLQPTPPFNAAALDRRRLPAPLAADLERKLLAELARTPDRLGFLFQPLKQQGLAASAGTTPFDVLFLFLSFFVLAAALLLVALLFRLGVERRAEELGVLAAVGLRPRQISRWFLSEGGLVAALGAGIGVALGVGYAGLMLTGLRTWWLGAIGTPFLQLHVRMSSLVVGYASGVCVSAGTIAGSLRGMRRVAVRALLAGEAWGGPTGSGVVLGQGLRFKEPRLAEGDSRLQRGALWVAGALLLAGGALGAAATQVGGEAQAGAFVGSGVLVLAALLLLIRRHLHARASGLGPRAALSSRSRWDLASLAMRNASRNPGRSATTIGLVAVASFLIVAMSAFHQEPTRTGTGGFELLAESSEPVLADLNRPETRRDLLGDDAAALMGSTAFGCRVQPGDDASCNNLYQAAQPRVLGVTDEFIHRFDDARVPSFAWASSAAGTAEEQANPWRLLRRAMEADQPIAVVLDRNTAMYSLQLYRGVGEEFAVRYAGAHTIRFRVAGLLANSVLQGSLLIGERDFVRCFPRVSGYRFFLIATPPEQSGRVAEVLEEQLGDQGFDAVSAAQRLEDLLAVQNTYLSTFQSLGVLGLVLGTFGLAAVQARNVLERRRELALLRAVGFRPARLAQLVMFENAGLLLGGLGTGAMAALLALVPHFWLGGAAIPVRDLGLMLGTVLLVGSLSSLLTIRTTLQAPVLPALRGE